MIEVSISFLFRVRILTRRKKGRQMKSSQSNQWDQGSVSINHKILLIRHLWIIRWDLLIRIRAYYITSCTSAARWFRTVRTPWRSDLFWSSVPWPRATVYKLSLPTASQGSCPHEPFPHEPFFKPAKGLSNKCCSQKYDQIIFGLVVFPPPLSPASGGHRSLVANCYSTRLCHPNNILRNFLHTSY